MPLSVQAAVVPILGHGFTRGISRVSYYIDYNSGTGFYEYLIINAEHNWESPGWTSPVNLVAASSNSGTMLDFYAKPNSYFPEDNADYYGMAEFYDNSGNPVIPDYQSYVFTRVQINDDANHYRNATEVQGTIAHEMGHTFGLAHPEVLSTNADSIMSQSWFRTVQTVQRCDTDALYKIY